MLSDCGRELLKPWLSVQNIVLMGAFVFLICLVIVRFELTRSEVASWVQAVGSIAAIWFALALGRQQMRSQDAARARALELKAGAFLAVFESAAKNADKISEIALRKERLSSFVMRWDLSASEIFRVNLNILKSIPAHELGGYELVVAHTAILSFMIKIERFIADLVEIEAAGRDIQQRWLDAKYEEIIECNRFIQVALETYQTANGELVKIFS